MSHFNQLLDDRTLCTTLSGVLGVSDLAAVQEAARDLIEKQGAIKTLVILQEFRGFATGLGWGDLSFFAQYGDQIVRMAIVGDPRWKADAFLFTGKGARRTEIEFFPVTELGQAQAWLKAAPERSGGPR